MNVLRQRTQIRADNHEAPINASGTERKTISWSELEDWQKDNEYIVLGYRMLQYSWWGCWESVFAYIHNETVNIHSHLWGSVLFVYFIISVTLNGLHPEATWIDTAVVDVFLVSAVFCLSGSAIFHTSTCHSQAVATRCHALDYTGIIVLIVGSFFPSIYYGFYCHPHLQVFYLATITIVGFGASMIVLTPEYSQPSHRVARTVIFIGLGLCAIVPITHIVLTTHGLHELLTEVGFGWLVASGAMYIIGATIYAKRFPEKGHPGKFDYFLASHQIFHFFVVLAALAHYKSVLTSLDYRTAGSAVFSLISSSHFGHDRISAQSAV
ncbi:hemolysin-III related-domain-containing protein [Ephemerocybe angulata]|uniref:Hemolysin-III related-domain-containing protein n=1 Tax=Ephemerocybe angulata TaxID=980116 RepID=A0A8H6MCM1_9AGAR|nr:hemolysin-III related-domain-containing protein [Tulosesus angulatus]